MVEQRANYVIQLEISQREMRPVEGWGFYTAYAAVPQDREKPVRQFDSPHEAAEYLAVDGVISYQVPSGLVISMHRGQVEGTDSLGSLLALDPVAYARLIEKFGLRNPAVAVNPRFKP